jgi:hypothetical protein
MKYEFIQLICTKTNGEFIVCSNISLMEYQHLSPMDALLSLQAMAVEAEVDGFSVQWAVSPMSEKEIAEYGGLFAV